jgi:3-oxoacyl-[acyl-carrier protein] reductase
MNVNADPDGVPDSNPTTGDFAGRTGAALVTGGTGGIGAAICRMLAQRGSDVFFTFRTNAVAAAELEAELHSYGVGCVSMAADLVDENMAALVVERTLQEFGGMHTFVHAAGPHVAQMHLSRVEPSMYRSQIEGEAVAFFNVAQPSLAHLRIGGGSIVAVTTAATRRYPVRDGLSSGTKGAVEAVVRAIAAEEGRFGIRANCVGPGMLTDGMAARLMASGDLDDAALEVTMRNIPLRKFGDAIDIAEAVCFLASDRADFISGQMLDVDGGYGV